MSQSVVAATLAFSGAVIINVTGKFTDDGGSLRTLRLPSNLQVFSSYTGSNGVTVSGTSATYMSIYAPGTDVTISGGRPFYGSLVGKTLTVSGNSSLHQDLDLPLVLAVAGFRANTIQKKIGPALFFYINILCKEASKTRSV